MSLRKTAQTLRGASRPTTMVLGDLREAVRDLGRFRGYRDVIDAVSEFLEGAAAVATAPAEEIEDLADSYGFDQTYEGALEEIRGELDRLEAERSALAVLEEALGDLDPTRWRRP
jgi:hypothetical protein